MRRVARSQDWPSLFFVRATKCASHVVHTHLPGDPATRRIVVWQCGQLLTVVFMGRALPGCEIVSCASRITERRSSVSISTA